MTTKIHCKLLNKTYPSLLWCIEEEEYNVDGFNDDTKRVNGDEKQDIALKHCIVYPKHGTE
ncbi:hypothetical protein Hanom_Chr12g01180241 [Helianthus anomalus]